MSLHLTTSDVAQVSTRHSADIHWWREFDQVQNFGDYLGCYLHDRLAIASDIPIAADSCRLIGSVIDDFIVEQDIATAANNPDARIAFWGCGARESRPLAPGNAARSIFLGVRGPLTRDLLGLPTTTALGDPAFLLPLVFAPPRSPSGPTICVPHINDQQSDDAVAAMTGVDEIVRPTIPASFDDLEDMIGKIASASFVLAGSLHAAIVACAYDVPFCPWAADHLDLPFKWRDFSASIGIGAFFARDLAEARRLWDAAMRERIVKPCLVPILASAPFAVQTPFLVEAEISDAPPLVFSERQAAQARLAAVRDDLERDIARLTHRINDLDAARSVQDVKARALSVEKNRLAAELNEARSRGAAVSAHLEQLRGRVEHHQKAFLYKVAHAPRAAARGIRAAARPIGFHRSGEPRGWLRTLGHHEGRPLIDASTPAPISEALLAPPLASIAPPSPTARTPGPVVLFAADYPPLYDHHSGGLRLLSVIRIAGRDHKLVFVSLASGNDLPGPLATREGRARYEGVLKEAGVVSILYGRDELALALDDPDFRFSHAFLSFPDVAESLMPLIRDRRPEAEIHYDMVDFHALRMAREAELRHDPLLAVRADAMREREVCLAREADIVVAISREEKAVLLDIVPEANAAVLPNVFVIPSAKPPGPRGRRDILFVGGFWHTPNGDAVKWFANEVWPRLIERFPDLRFIIAGSNPSDDITALAVRPAIEVRGYIPDLAPLYQSARVSVAPLRFRAGLKGKVGEAMAHGLPVVGTPIAFEGMHEGEDRHFLCEEDPEKMAEAISLLILDDGKWLAVQAAARDYISRHFSTAAIAPMVAALFDAAPSVQ